MELRQYGVATTVYFPLIDKGATDLESTPVTIASGDCKISKDGGAFANTTTASFSHVAGGIYSIPLTATEMQAKQVILKIVDQTGTKEWEDQVIIITTINHASAEIPTVAPTAADVRSAVGLGSANLDTQLGAIDDYIDTEVTAILSAVDTEVAAIKAKTDNLPSDPADASDIAALIDAIPTANENADALLKRDLDQVEASAAIHSPASAFLKLVSRFVASTGVTYRTNGSTVHMTQTPTTNAGADPVTELGVAA
jgi:hypothetical protein